VSRVRAHGRQRRTRQVLGGRATWILLDQAVSSLANAGLSVIVATTVSPGDYGAFALAFSFYTFLVAVSQAMSGQTFMIRYSGVGGVQGAWAASGAAGAAAALGVLLAVILGVASLGLGPPLSGTVAALSVLLPALLLQDMWRTVFIARGTPARAFVNDLVWTVLQVVFIGALVAASVHEAMWYLLAWGAAASVAAAVGVRQCGSWPSLRAAVPFVRSNLDLSLPSVGGAVAILGATQVAFVLISVVGGVEDVGALRAAQTLLGPLNILGFALTAAALPEIARRDLTRRGLLAAAAAVSGALVLASLAWGAVLLAVPDSVGVRLLGESWRGAREALPGLVVFTACIGATVGATLVIRALARTGYAMATQVLLGVLVIGLGVGGVAVDGARGAAIGLALAAAVLVVPCWALLTRAIRLGRREAPVRLPAHPAVEVTAGVPQSRAGGSGPAAQCQSVPATDSASAPLRAGTGGS